MLPAGRAGRRRADYRFIAGHAIDNDVKKTADATAECENKCI